MFCKFCGAEVDDKSVFCIKCGNNIAEKEAEPLSAAEQQPEVHTVQTQPASEAVKKPIKKINKKTILIIVGIVVAIVLCITIFGGSKSEKEKECEDIIRNICLGEIGYHYGLTVGEILDMCCDNVNFDVDYSDGVGLVSLTGIASYSVPFEVDFWVYIYDDGTYSVEPWYAELYYDDDPVYTYDSSIAWKTFVLIYDSSM